MDGMAGRPLKELNNQTTLQAAKTPNMDKMAERGITGLMDSIAPGIIPGSDTAHLSILGYNPYEVYTGRGPFEAVGVGVDVIPGDIAFRCNFSTSDEDGIITDRRAGRIRDGTDEIVATLNTMKIEGYEDIEIIYDEIERLSPFPESRDFIQISKMPVHNITIGAALPYIREFLP